MNMDKKQRVREYSILRVFAILLVVIGHSLYIEMLTPLGGVSYDYALNEHRIFRIYGIIVDWIYQFHMPLFFMLSGAVYHLSEKKTLDELVKNKTKRLIIPFFIYGILFMLPIKKIGNFYLNVDFSNVIKSFFDGSEAGHLWFLPSLFWVSIVFYLLLKIFKNKSNIGLLIVSFVIQKYYLKYIPIDIFFLSQGMLYIFWYALGYCFEEIREKYNEVSKFNKSILTIILLIIIIIDIKNNILNSYSKIIINSLLIYNISFLISYTKFGMSKIIDILEKYSMYIYLFHDPLEYLILRFAFQYNMLNSKIGIIIYILSRTIGVIIISLVLAILIKKIKMILKDKNFKKYLHFI